MELTFSCCGCKKSVLDVFGDHVSTCAVHSGAKKAHDWEVEQFADLFLTTHRTKTQQVVSGVSDVGTLNVRSVGMLCVDHNEKRERGVGVSVNASMLTL